MTYPGARCGVRQQQLRPAHREEKAVAEAGVGRRTGSQWMRVVTFVGFTFLRRAVFQDPIARSNLKIGE